MTPTQCTAYRFLYFTSFSDKCHWASDHEPYKIRYSTQQDKKNKIDTELVVSVGIDQLELPTDTKKSYLEPCLALE